MGINIESIKCVTWRNGPKRGHLKGVEIAYTIRNITAPSGKVVEQFFTTSEAVSFLRDREPEMAKLIAGRYDAECALRDARHLAEAAYYDGTKDAEARNA